MNGKKLYNKRKTYTGRRISPKKSPIALFDSWFKEALKHVVDEPHAMALATATKSGKPSVRMVLLKSYDKNGFTFFTNYQSKKGRELLENPYASLCFYWPNLHHQVRIEGTVQKVNPSVSQTYFSSRPIGSQRAAIASKQSRPIHSYQALEKLFVDILTHTEKLQCPEEWGGFILKPTAMEFWSGMPNRLHHRIRYTKKGSRWTTQTLCP